MRTILGKNAVRVLDLDTTVLRSVADRIGPTPEEFATSLASDDFPAYRSIAIREQWSFH